jgi:hypothetical protein
MSSLPENRLGTIALAALTYFGLVFGAGFILGPIRIFFIMPRIGERAAELIEMPIMLTVTVFAARWIVRRLLLSSPIMDRLGVGLLALALMILFEFSVALGLRGLTLTQYFRDRDPIGATAYYLALGAFAIMPLLVRRRTS